MEVETIFLGQPVFKYHVPLEVFVALNELYDTHKKLLPNANKQLAGKILDEVSLFYAGPTNKKMHTHSYVSEDLMKWFYSIFNHYLKTNKFERPHLDINSIWVNEMKAGEYNPVHVHRGKLFTGLSSVMILKLPKDMGAEIARPEQPMNGQLQFLGNVAGQFVTSDYSPRMRIGDFYVFPYDIRHVVYPFTNKKEKRRTLVCNCDVDYDVVGSRTTQ
jgi:hypothetical protein|tara:strand:- start:306 stop:956 length:651 start_codon:yes stop_codon:yes gene_type:complete